MLFRRTSGSIELEKYDLNQCWPFSLLPCNICDWFLISVFLLGFLSVIFKPECWLALSTIDFLSALGERGDKCLMKNRKELVWKVCLVESVVRLSTLNVCFPELMLTVCCTGVVPCFVSHYVLDQPPIPDRAVHPGITHQIWRADYDARQCCLWGSWT